MVFSEEWSNSVVEAGEPDAFEPTSIDERILVRAVQSQAESRTIFLEVRGQTTANRTVQVMSEVTGKVVALPGEKGSLARETCFARWPKTFDGLNMVKPLPNLRARNSNMTVLSISIKKDCNPRSY